MRNSILIQRFPQTSVEIGVFSIRFGVKRPSYIIETFLNDFAQ
ncbi:hypothetical protein LEP1GSC058_1677 [Leptospira fainei serovar Hurstbridge str. BUT 6]|uniref:Uncharacterized protein n=1 Tax=Leptospira fainei serovar Hurstbridge str. BUT 6 TaxID=1193011 RepID=S3UW68_9LEPT|nr:hypothetical protein LEP1GSC058_1677 [Leptospira fainei serovar Hurstbridge str. BUT 6]